MAENPWQQNAKTKAAQVSCTRAASFVEYDDDFDRSDLLVSASRFVEQCVDRLLSHHGVCRTRMLVVEDGELG